MRNTKKDKLYQYENEQFNEIVRQNQQEEKTTSNVLTKEKKQFRLRGKKLILTYSNLKKQFKSYKLKKKYGKTEIPYIFPMIEQEDSEFFKDFLFTGLVLHQAKEKILLNLLEKDKLPKIKQYIVAEELHKGGDLHYHVYLEFKQRVELFGSGCLDLHFDDLIIHGSYETVRKKDNVLTYITKCDNFIAEPDIPYYDGELFSNFKDFLIALYNKEGMSGFKKYLVRNTEALVKGGSLLLKHFETSEKLKRDELMFEQDKNLILPIKYFDIPYTIEEWYEKNRFKQALFVMGKSGIGKTEGIKSFLDSKGVSYLLVRNIHGLIEYNPEKHQAILFDDLDLEKFLTEEKHISLTDLANHTDVRILRYSIRILAKTLRIFITNDPRKIIGYGVDKYQVLRRYTIIKVDKSLFKEDIHHMDLEFSLRSVETDELVARNRKLLQEWDQEMREEKQKSKIKSGMEKDKLESESKITTNEKGMPMIDGEPFFKDIRNGGTYILH